MSKLCYSAFIAFWTSVATMLALQLLAEDEPAAVTPVYGLEQVTE